MKQVFPKKEEPKENKVSFAPTQARQVAKKPSAYEIKILELAIKEPNRPQNMELIASMKKKYPHIFN
jgi:hypothetical protein